MVSLLDIPKLIAGDASALSSGLSWVARADADAVRQALELIEAEKRSRRIIISGPPGVGKSTLLRAILAEIRRRGERAGVIACDPSSARTGGAFLGDRVRWSELAEDEGVFIRSLAKSTSDERTVTAIDAMSSLFEAAGFDWVFLETVGAGQSEEPGLTGAPTLLVLSPVCGDEMQMLKAGVVESADLYAVNRLDLPGGERWAAQLEETLALGAGAAPIVLRIDAQTGTGVGELVEELVKVTASSQESDERTDSK